jgi:SAM-dependent methyltransferase
MSAHPVLNAPDEVDRQTLQRIEKMDRFNQWMSDVILPYINGTVLEVGCGIGNVSQYLLAAGHPVVGVDLCPDYVGYACDRLHGTGDFQGYVADITGDIPAPIAGRRFDTVVMLNVLEHIADEKLALRSLVQLCQPGGRLVCLVPAYEWLYGSLDVHLGHYRRYDRRMLKHAVIRAGFQPEHCFHFNAAGIPGWWVNSRVRRSKVLPANQLSLYNRLVPLFRGVDVLTGGRVGQSVIIVARR